MSLLKRAGVAFVACAAFSGAAYYFINIYAFALSLCAVGLFFPRIAIDFMAEMGWLMRTSMLQGLSGQHYQYLGWRLQIWEDEYGYRWVPIDDVRRIVGHLASETTLAHIYANGYQRLGKPETGYLRDDALMTHLANAPSARAIKFKNWAERNIAFPARTKRNVP